MLWFSHHKHIANPWKRVVYGCEFPPKARGSSQFATYGRTLETSWWLNLSSHHRSLDWSFIRCCRKCRFGFSLVAFSGGCEARRISYRFTWYMLLFIIYIYNYILYDMSTYFYKYLSCMMRKSSFFMMAYRKTLAFVKFDTVKSFQNHLASGGSSLSKALTFR